jgi:hypothetical protein
MSISSGPETESSYIYWAELSMFHLKTEAEFSLRNILFQIKDKTMDNVKKCDTLM